MGNAEAWYRAVAKVGVRYVLKQGQAPQVAPSSLLQPRLT